jgi:hypothetical protein
MTDTYFKWLCSQGHIPAAFRFLGSRHPKAARKHRILKKWISRVTREQKRGERVWGTP